VTRLTIEQTSIVSQEERIVFISTVLSKPEALPPAAHALRNGDAADLHLGFWRNPKRFNVAITRAKALLVIVGHPVLLVEVRLFHFHHSVAHIVSVSVCTFTPGNTSHVWPTTTSDVSCAPTHRWWSSATLCCSWSWAA